MSGNVVESVSSSTVAASWKSIPCFLRLAAAFLGSHLKTTISVYALAGSALSVGLTTGTSPAAGSFAGAGCVPWLGAEPLLWQERHDLVPRPALSFPCGLEDRFDVEAVFCGLCLANAPDLIDDVILRHDPILPIVPPECKSPETRNQTACRCSPPPWQ